MRAKQFITEANLAPAELRKHGGKYIKLLVRKIQDGEMIDIVPDKQDVYGPAVVLTQDSADKLIKAWFGTTEMPDMGDINLSPNNDVIPADPKVAKIELETKDGKPVLLGYLQKTPEYKGGRTFNAGDIGEGLLGAAVTARFVARDKDITEEDVLAILKQMGEGELVGKNNMKGATVHETSKNDKVHFHLSLNQANYNVLQGIAKNRKDMHPEILGLLRSSVTFANQNSGVLAACETIIADKNSNSVTVSSDGVSDQKGTKADLFLDVDGTTVNLLSLKAGDIKQFGQKSGYSFEQVDAFFNDTFGVNIPNNIEAEFESGDAETSFKAIHKVYNIVGKQLKSELAGDNTNNEVAFIERLYRGIKQHAVGANEDTTLVILKTTPNAAGFSELQFGQPLRDAMDNIDLDVEWTAPGTSTAVIKVFGTPKDGGKKELLIQVRSNYKSESGGYVRNIVEMGKLLKIIAAIEVKLAEK